MTGLDDRAPERDRQMRLPDPGRAEDQHILDLGQETRGGQLADQSAIDRRLKLEIEIIERLDRREVRDFQAHLDARPLLGVDHLAEHAGEKVEIRGLGPRGVIQQGVDPLGDVAE